MVADEFKTIETQEELDRIITDRLSRNTQSVTAEVTKKFEGYVSPDDYKKLSDSISEKDSEIEKLKAENSKYVTSTVKMRIARESGLPLELADRIAGDDEKAMRADAAALVKLITPTAPLGSTEKGKTDENEKYRKLLKDL